ncbi:hypothetical protein HYT56_01705 [Candidatus Woesearchaeota archaeon]|nr:hypothetical protein [Candidatus Woesearchaeota archaeon]
MKCDICRNEIAKSFLGKIKGTYIKINKDKKIVCDECQSRYKNLKEKFS